MGAGASQPKQPKGVSTKSIKVPLHIAVQAVVLIQTRVRIYLARKKLKQLRDTKSDQQKKAADIVKNMKIKTDKMSRKINVLTRRSISAEDDESIKSENTLRKSGLIKAPMMLSSKMSQRFYPSQQQRSVALGDMSKSLAAALDSDQVFSTDGPGGADKGLIVSEEIIYPFIGFVIKTQVFATLRKLFINVTHSPRVPQMLASPVRQWTDCTHHDADGQLVASEVTLVDVVIPSSDFDSLFVFKLGIGIVPIDETKKRDLATACVEYVNALYSEDGNGASARLKSKKRQRQKRLKPKRKPSEDNINVFNEEDEENYVEDESEEEEDEEDDEEDETGLFCSKQFKLPRIKRNYVGAIVPLCLTPVPTGGSGSSDEGDFNSSSGSVSVSVSFLEPFRLSLNNNPNNNNGNDSGSPNNNDGDDELEVMQSKRVVSTPVLAESKGSAMLTPPVADAKQAPTSATAAAAAAALAVAQAKEHLQEKEDDKGVEDPPDDEEEEEELLFPPDLCADMALAWSCVNAAPPPPSLADAKTAVRSSIAGKKDDKPRSPRRGRKDKRNSRGKSGDPFDLDSSDEDEDHEHPDTDDHDEGSTVGSQRHKGENAAAAAAAASAKGLEAHQRHYLRALKTWQRGHGIYVEVVNGVLTIYRRRSLHQISLLPTKVQQKVYAAHDETSEGTDLIAADDVVPIPLHRALPGGEDEIARLSLSSLDITYDERDGAERDLFYLHLDVTYDAFNVDALAYTARGRQLRRQLRRQQRHRLKAQAKQQRLEERRKKVASGHYFSDDEEEDEDDGYDAKLEEELDEEDDDRYDYALDSALLRVDPDFSIAAGASAAAASTQPMSTTMNTTSNAMSLTHMSSTTSINKLGGGPTGSSRSAILSPLQLAAQTRQLLHATHARHVNRLAFPSLFKDNKRITLQFHSSGEAKAWQLYLEQHAFFLQQTLPRYNNYCEHNLHLLNAPIAHIYKAQLPHYSLLKRLDVQFMPQIAEPKTGGSNGASSESKGDDKKTQQDTKDALEPLPVGSSKVHHNHHLEHVLEEESLHSHNMYVPAQAGRRPSHAPSISTAQQVGLQLQGLPFHLQSPTNHNSNDPRNNSNLLDYHKLHNYNYNNQHPGPRNNTPATRLLQKLRYAYPGDTLPSSSDSEHNISEEDEDLLNPNSKANRMRNRRRNKRESRVRIPVTGGAPPAYTTCITLRLRTPTHTPYAHTNGVLEEGEEIVEMEDYADADLIALAETHPLYPPDGPDRRKVWIKLDRGYLFVYETLSEMLTAHTASAEERLADLGASTATQILTLAGYRVHAKHKKVIRKRNYMSRYTLRKHIPVVNNPLLFTSRTSYATTAATSKGIARPNANGKSRRHQHPVANVAPPLLHHTSWMHPVGGRCDLIVELFVRSATGALDLSNMQLLTALKQHIAYADLQTQVVSRLAVLEEGGVLEVAQQIALLQQGMPVNALATNKTRVQMTMHSLQCLVSVTLPPAEVTSDDDSDLDERRILPHVTLRAFRVVRPPFFDINMVFMSKNSGSARTMNDVMMQWRDLLTAQYECFPRPTLLSANSSQAAASHITTRTANVEEVPPVGCFFACSLVYLQESHMLCFFHDQTLFAVLCLTRCLEKAQTRPDRLHSTAMLYGDKNALGMLTPSRHIQNHRPGSQSSMRSATNKRQMATQHQQKHHTPAPPRPLNSAIYQLDSSSDSDDDSDDDIRQMAADFDSGNHHGGLLGSPKNGGAADKVGGKKRKKNDEAHADSDSDRDYDFEPLNPLMQMLLKQSLQSTTVTTAAVSPVKNAPLRSSAQLSSKSPMGSNSSSMKMSRNQAEDLLSAGPETTSQSNLPDLQTLNNSLTNLSFSTQLMAPKPAEANHSSEDERMGVYFSRQNRRKRRRLRRKQRHHRIMRIDGPDSSDSDDAEDHVDEEEESEGEAERDLQVYLHAVGRFQRHQNPPQPHNYFQSSSTSQRIQPAKSASTRSLLVPTVANIQTLPAMSPAVMEAEEEYFVELLAYDQRTYRLRFPCRRDFLHWIRLVAPHKRHHHQQQHNDSLRNTLRVSSHPGNLNLPPGSNLNAHLSSKGLVSARLPPHNNMNSNSNNATGNNNGNSGANAGGPNSNNGNGSNNATSGNSNANAGTTNKRGMNAGKDDGGLRGAEHTPAMSSAASSRISNKTGNTITPHLLATANSNMNSSSAIEEHSTKFVRGRLGSTPMNKDTNKDTNKDNSSALSNKNLLNPASIDNEATRKYTRLLRGGEKVLGAGIVLRQEKASSAAASSGFGRAFAAVASVANGNKRLMLLVTDFPRLLFVDVANNSAVLRGHIDLLIFDKCDSRTEGNSEVVEVSSSSNSSSPMTRFTAADENKDKDAKFWLAKIRYAAGK